MDGQTFEYWLEETLSVGDDAPALSDGARFSTPVGTSARGAHDALMARVTMLQACGWHIEALGGETFTAAKNDTFRTLWLAANVRSEGGAA